MTLTTTSDVIACDKCDRTFHTSVVFNFHMNNTHPLTSQTTSILSQVPGGSTLKSGSSKRKRSKKNFTKVRSNKISPIKKELSSLTQDPVDLSNTVQDGSLVSITKVTEESIVDEKMLDLSQTVTQNEKQLKCQICSKSFRRSFYLTGHMKRAHTESTSFKCNLCGKCFNTNTNLIQHTNGVHASERKFQCLPCKKAFTLRNHLRVHTRTVHENIRPHKCSVCEKSFHLRDGLKTHIAWVHEKERNFRCEMCGAGFIGEYFLKMHTTRSHDESKPLECQICKMRFSRKGSLTGHVTQRHTPRVAKTTKSTVRSEPPVKCEYCTKMFTSQMGVQIHHGREHKDVVLPGNQSWDSPLQKVKCEYCDKKFKSLRCVQIHHSKEHKEVVLSSRVCKICNKVFKSAFYVAIHVKIVHENIKKYECEFCKQTFALPLTYKTHVNAIHKNIKRFGCSNCEERFSSSELRNRHNCLLTSPTEISNSVNKENSRKKIPRKSNKKVLENAKSLKCQDCPRLFTRQWNLEKHMFLIHPSDKIFECHVCKKSFPLEVMLHRHIKKSHNNFSPLPC